MNEPSPWVVEHETLIPEGGAVLDVACGKGRHTRHFLSRGHLVTAIDKDVSGLTEISGAEGLEIIEADLEIGGPWPLGARTFAGVIVTNYLHRPLLPALVGAVGPGGALIYDTFAAGNEAYGKPTRSEFLLKEGELLEAIKTSLDVRAYDHGFVDKPPSIRQRLCAVRRWNI